jgi:hypothetical protein
MKKPAERQGGKKEENVEPWDLRLFLLFLYEY